MLMFTPDEGRISSLLTLTPSSLASFQPQSSSNMELLPVKPFPATSVKSTMPVTRAVFGWEDDSPAQLRHRQPLDMEVPICVDLDRFVERSNGVLGNPGREIL